MIPPSHSVPLIFSVVSLSVLLLSLTVHTFGVWGP